MFVYFRQYWTDKRLAHGTEATLMLGGTDVNRIWLPDTYINNANDHEVFEDNQLVLIDKNGQIVYFAYARIAAACQMKLVKFPMDVQQCHLTLESCKYETKTVGGSCWTDPCNLLSQKPMVKVLDFLTTLGQLCRS